MNIGKCVIRKDEPMTIWLWNDNKKFDSPHLLRATKIDFIENHLYFYFGRELIFKVWLKKKYKDLKSVLKDLKIKIY